MEKRPTDQELGIDTKVITAEATIMGAAHLVPQILADIRLQRMQDLQSQNSLPTDIISQNE